MTENQDGSPSMRGKKNKDRYTDQENYIILSSENDRIAGCIIDREPTGISKRRKRLHDLGKKDLILYNNKFTDEECLEMAIKRIETLKESPSFGMKIRTTTQHKFS